MNNKPQSPRIFIDGKAQVIEMFRHMALEHRQQLLKNIRAQNPDLAEELATEGLSFSALGELDDRRLAQIFLHIRSPILGIALRGLARPLQQRILSLAPREYAQEAYEAMTKRIDDAALAIERAQRKVKEVLAHLNRQRAIMEASEST